MRIRIDRDLPVPVPIQIQGQIEYGMSTGDFPAGSRLPSVRELSTDLGVSPVTVGTVYRALAERGLLETLQGRGTFVRDRGTPSVDPPPPSAEPLDDAIARLLTRADRSGVSRSELVARVQRAASIDAPALRPVRIVFVGIYAEATRIYASAVRPHLRPDDRLEVVTFDQVRDERGTKRRLSKADAILTFAHREHELAPHLPAGARLATVRLIPSARTRTELAELDPRARLCLVSDIPEFLPTFRRSVERFAPHVSQVAATPLDAHDLPALLDRSDVVVYGTGSERVLSLLPPHLRAFEHRHEPDPVHLERTLLPWIARTRREIATIPEQAPAVRPDVPFPTP
ncbi:MAG: GntR family transcriptional regulator [Trueperaceae bacterium]